jgi:hypothetical protein
MKNSTFIIILVIVGAVGLGIGKMLAPSDIEDDFDNETAEQESIETIQGDESKKVVKTVAKLDSSKEVPSKIKKLDPKSIPGMLKNNQLGSRYNKLKETFSDNEVGNQLLETFTFIGMQEMVGTAESKLVSDHMDALADNPYETVKELKIAFDKLPAEFSDAKQNIIQLVSRYEMDEDAKVEFLVEEATRAVPVGSDGKMHGQSTFNPSMALTSLSYIKGETDYMSKHITTILDAHKSSPDIVHTLIHEYGIKHPKEAEALKNQYGL